jgi:hypothetical protein
MVKALKDYEEKEQGALIDLFCFVMLLSNHVFFANAVGRVILGSSAIDTLLVYGILAWFTYKAMPALFRTIDVRAIIMILLTLIYVGLSVLLNAKLNQEIYTVAIRDTAIAITVGIYLAAKISDMKLLLKKLEKVSAFAAVEMIVSFAIYHFILKVEWGSGSMGLSYRMLVPTILVFYTVLQKFELKRLLLLILLIAILILQGSRGPVIATLVFPFLYVTVNSVGNFKKTFLLWVVFILVAVYILRYLDDILLWLSGIMEKYNFDSKTVRLILSGDIFDPNGRDKIANDAWEVVLNNPIGVGYFGERPLIDIYCHNIFLELMVDFGLVIGGIISIVFVGLVVKKSIRSSVAERNVLLILLCAFIIKLLFSGSFWTEVMFFVFATFLLKKNNNATQAIAEEEENFDETDFNS